MPESIPPRGIKYTDLIKAGSDGLGPNSHGVERASIKGSGINGFFKPVSVERHYPALLAKWSVAISQMYRVFMGDDAADERLVFYENGEIAGTFSVAAAHARPLLFSGEFVSDPKLNLYINPSAETLIQLNMTQLLVTSWFMKEDDLHAAQILFCYDGLDKEGHYINPRYVRIDFDMSHYDRTGKIKGFRVLDGIWRELAEKNLSFKSSQVTHFPNLVDGPYYWPTKTGVFGHKDCKSSESFQKLPHAKTKRKLGKHLEETTNFKLQKFESILKQLLLFQPNAIRLRLLDSLSADTKKGPTELTFIDEVLKHEQDNYDEFYLATVFYRGDEKLNDPSFKDFLRRRPSAFKKVLQFAEEMNDKFEEQGLPGAFNLKEMEQKYHQIWRDAYWPQFNDIRLLAFKYYQTLAKEVTVSTDSMVENSELSELKDESGKVTRAADLFPVLSVEKLANIEIKIDTKSPLREAFETAQKIIPQLIKDIETYFNEPTDSLSQEHNAKMVKRLGIAKEVLFSDFNLKKVGDGTDIYENLRSLLSLITETAEDVNLERHYEKRDLGNKDKPIDCNDKNARPEAGLLPYNDPYVVHDVISCIFDWAEKNREQFHKLVEAAIKLYGEKSRAEPIRTYLRYSGETGNNQLAYIFSTGGWECDSSILSTSLNIHLFNLLLRKINHPTLQPELERRGGGDFSDEFYISELKRYVVSSEHLFHPHHDTAFPLFEESMYKWVDEQWKSNKGTVTGSTSVFEDKLLKAISAYNSNRIFGASMWRDSSTEIVKMLNEGKSYTYILAKVLTTSGPGENSLATNLIKQIWAEVIQSNKNLSVMNYLLQGQEFQAKLAETAGKVVEECKLKEDNMAMVAAKGVTTKTWKWF